MRVVLGTQSGHLALGRHKGRVLGSICQEARREKAEVRAGGEVSL